jgi:hypothetical protein
MMDFLNSLSGAQNNRGWRYKNWQQGNENYLHYRLKHTSNSRERTGKPISNCGINFHNNDNNNS